MFTFSSNVGIVIEAVADTWLRCQSFKMSNRRQTARAGFIAGVQYAERKARQKEIESKESADRRLAHFEALALTRTKLSPSIVEAWCEFNNGRIFDNDRFNAFQAGWRARKLAELKSGMGLAKAYGGGWVRQHQDALRDVEAIQATAEGRNWFRDSKGKIWIDIPRAAMTSFGIPTDRPLTVRKAEAIYRAIYWCGDLDAGIPVG